MAGAYSYATQLGIGTADPVDTRLNFESESLILREEHVQTAGNFGTRSEPKERVVEGLRRVGGQIQLTPNIVELNALLEWIMCGTPTVGTPAGKTTFPLADTIVQRRVSVDRISKVFHYANVVVDRATFRSTQGGPLELTLDLIADDEETPGAAGSFPALSLDLTTNALRHSEAVLTINSVAHKCPSVELIVDNQIDEERFFNSTTLTSLEATGRQVLLNTQLPYGDSSAAFDLSSAGVTADLTYTSGSYSLQFSIAAIQIPPQSPQTQRGEIFLPIAGVCRKSSTTDELSTILDLTA